MGQPPADAGPPDAGPPDDAGMAGVEGRLRAVQADVELLRDIVDDFLHPAATTDVDGQPGPGEEVFQPRYPGLEEWVVDYFTPMFSRPLSPSLRWCASWWHHAEAISRLEALWRTWEVARLDPLRGMAVWYRDHLDTQLPVLLSATGPFAQCAPDRHAATRPLPTTAAPDGYWDDQPDAEPPPGGASNPHP